MKNTSVTLARRPNGYPVPQDFAVVETEVLPPRAGEALVENVFISMDAGFRNWMDEDAGDDVLPAMALSAPVMGLTIGRVVETQRSDLPVGTITMGRLAWQSYSLAGQTYFLVVLEDDPDIPLNYHLGILGDTGMSAYFGLHDVAKPTATDTVLVSAAGGAVGIIAGQVARIMGAKRVVGFAGSDEKCRRLETAVGYDVVINYKTGDVADSIAAACPEGVDVYFDNVGGSLLDPVLLQINQGARIAACGAVADYTSDTPGAKNLFQLVTNSARMEGFMTHLRVDRYPEARTALMGWLKSGELKNFEHQYEGVEHCGTAFSDLFAGANFGKTIVKVT